MQRNLTKHTTLRIECAANLFFIGNTSHITNDKELTDFFFCIMLYGVSDIMRPIMAKFGRAARVALVVRKEPTNGN